MIKGDGREEPFPCDGTLPHCAREHDGSVVVQGPSAINMAAPLVCDMETRECLSDLCALVDQCNEHGTCVSSVGIFTCSRGYSGDRCETHTCCSNPGTCCGCNGDNCCGPCCIAGGCCGGLSNTALCQHNGADGVMPIGLAGMRRVIGPADDVPSPRVVRVVLVVVKGNILHTRNS